MRSASRGRSAGSPSRGPRGFRRRSWTRSPFEPELVGRDFLVDEDEARRALAEALHRSDQGAGGLEAVGLQDESDVDPNVEEAPFVLVHVRLLRSSGLESPYSAANARSVPHRPDRTSSRTSPSIGP